MVRRNILALIVLLCLLAFPQFAAGAETSNADETTVATLRIGAILPISGSLDSSGRESGAALEMAVQAVNEALAEEDSDIRIELVVKDSQGIPERALQLAKQLFDDGARIFVIDTSAEITHMKPWASEHQVTIISHASTAPSLGIVGDGIFRMVPNDRFQAKALAALMKDEGFEQIALLYRDDEYGRELSSLIAAEFGMLSGKNPAAAMYLPNENALVAAVRSIREQLESSSVENAKTAIVAVAFEELFELLSQSEPVQGLRWFATEAMALHPDLVGETNVAPIASSVQLITPMHGFENTPSYEAVKASIENSLGQSITRKAAFAYDIPGLLAHIAKQMDNPDNTNELHEKWIEYSTGYVGVTGPISFDEAGDRQHSHYDFWQVQEQSAAYDWVNIGTYRTAPDGTGVLEYDTRYLHQKVENALNELYGPDYLLELDQNMSRADFVESLAALLNWQGESSELEFVDADQIEDTQRRAIALAVERGVVQGYEDAHFRPSASITHVEAAAILVRALGISMEDMKSSEFADDTDVPVWAKDYAAVAVDLGLFDFAGHNRFSPRANVSRAQAVTLLTHTLIHLK